MRIGIDTRWVEYKAGVYRVIVDLFTHMIMLPEAQKHQFVLFGVDIFAERNLPRPANVRVVPLVGWKRRLFQGLWKTIMWPPLDWLTGKLDIVHFTNFVSVPMFCKAKKVVTIHDMAWKIFPETIEKKNLKFLRRFCERSIRDADMVHCVSDFTAYEILRLVDGVKPENVVVAKNSINTLFSSEDDQQDVLVAKSSFDFNQLPQKFVLFVGTLEPRKNLDVLLQSMARLWDEGSDVELVIVGARGWSKDVHVGREHVQKVTFTGFVSDHELLRLYSLAEVFVFPSKYEGFGIPILESMSCNTPVICSDIPVFNELCGNCCVYFDPAENMAANHLHDALVKVLAGGEEIEDMVFRAKMRVEDYSWEASARKLLKLYEEKAVVCLL